MQRCAQQGTQQSSGENEWKQVHRKTDQREKNDGKYI